MSRKKESSEGKSSNLSFMIPIASLAFLLIGNKEKPMTRDNGTWSYRWNGITISAPTLEKLIKAVAELGLLEGGEE